MLQSTTAACMALLPGLLLSSAPKPCRTVVILAMQPGVPLEQSKCRSSRASVTPSVQQLRCKHAAVLKHGRQGDGMRHVKCSCIFLCCCDVSVTFICNAVVVSSVPSQAHDARQRRSTITGSWWYTCNFKAQRVHASHSLVPRNCNPEPS